MIYSLETPGGVMEKMVQLSEHKQLLFRLPRERKEKAGRYKHDRDRMNCVFGYLVLQYGLRQEYGVSGTVPLGYSETGKPYLIETPQIFISLSHTEGVIACAVSSGKIGIDAQRWVRSFSDVVLYTMSAKEMKLIQQDAKNFTILWALKEAYYKYSGEGLSHDMVNLDMSACLSDESGSFQDLTYQWMESSSGILASIGEIEEEITFVKVEMLFN